MSGLVIPAPAGIWPSRPATPSVRIHHSSGLVSQSRYASRALIKIRTLPTHLRYVGEMVPNEFCLANAPRPSDEYFRLNVAGAPRAVTVTARPEETFPGLPRGFSKQPLATCSADE
jgi:hypothetical protein